MKKVAWKSGDTILMDEERQVIATRDTTKEKEAFGAAKYEIDLTLSEIQFFISRRFAGTWEGLYSHRSGPGVLATREADYKNCVMQRGDWGECRRFWVAQNKWSYFQDRVLLVKLYDFYFVTEMFGIFLVKNMLQYL